jgi:hypothetical protein
MVPLTIHDSTGNIIEQNIYAANIAVWNSGNVELRSDDIREPFRLIVEGNSVKLIEVTPVFYTRDNVDGFDINSGTGEIKWKHFDAGEGFKLRVIYANSTLANIAIIGYAINTPIVD